MIRALAAALLIAGPTAASAQSMAGMAMPDMVMPEMAMPASAAPSPPAGDAAPPPVPTDHYADLSYDPAAMDAARRRMMHDEGGRTLHRILFNLAEIQARRGGDGYRWDAEGYVGGDVDRLWIKSEGSGAIARGVDAAEVQALYGHAIGPYFDLQAGIRTDIRPQPSRAYATIAIEGLAPAMFETEAALFLSTRGDLLGRIEGWTDQRITQRLILQPRVELNLAAQDVRADRIGAGLTDAELGVRLRYELRRELAPYIGVSQDRRTGRSAAFARTDGQRAVETSLVAGVRAWF